MHATTRPRTPVRICGRHGRDQKQLDGCGLPLAVADRADTTDGRLCQSAAVSTQQRRASVDDLSIIRRGDVFQLHGAGQDGRTVLRNKLNRRRCSIGQVPRCVVAVEACANARYWRKSVIRSRGPVDPSFLRETLRVGRTMPRIRKRSPKFRLDKQCAYEHEERADKRISSIAFNVCDILVRQRTLAINPLRDMLREYG